VDELESVFVSRLFAVSFALCNFLLQRLSVGVCLVQHGRELVPRIRDPARLGLLPQNETLPLQPKLAYSP
jgi:hypothetical protein